MQITSPHPTILTPLLLSDTEHLHPHLRGYALQIEQMLNAKGPVAAHNLCAETTQAIGGLLDCAEANDPETLQLLASNGIEEEELATMMFWLGDRTYELSTTVN